MKQLFRINWLNLKRNAGFYVGMSIAAVISIIVAVIFGKLLEIDADRKIILMYTCSTIVPAAIVLMTFLISAMVYHAPQENTLEYMLYSKPITKKKLYLSNFVVALAFISACAFIYLIINIFCSFIILGILKPENKVEFWRTLGWFIAAQLLITVVVQMFFLPAMAIASTKMSKKNSLRLIPLLYFIFGFFKAFAAPFIDLNESRLKDVHFLDMKNNLYAGELPVPAEEKKETFVEKYYTDSILLKGKEKLISAISWLNMFSASSVDQNTFLQIANNSVGNNAAWFPKKVSVKDFKDDKFVLKNYEIYKTLGASNLRTFNEKLSSIDEEQLFWINLWHYDEIEDFCDFLASDKEFTWEKPNGRNVGMHPSLLNESNRINKDLRKKIIEIFKPNEIEKDSLNKFLIKVNDSEVNTYLSELNKIKNEILIFNESNKKLEYKGINEEKFISLISIVMDEEFNKFISELIEQISGRKHWEINNADEIARALELHELDEFHKLEEAIINQVSPDELDKATKNLKNKIIENLKDKSWLSEPKNQNGVLFMIDEYICFNNNKVFKNFESEIIKKWLYRVMVEIFSNKEFLETIKNFEDFPLDEWVSFYEGENKINGENIFDDAIEGVKRFDYEFIKPYSKDKKEILKLVRAVMNGENWFFTYFDHWIIDIRVRSQLIFERNIIERYYDTLPKDRNTTAALISAILTNGRTKMVNTDSFLTKKTDKFYLHTNDEEHLYKVVKINVYPWYIVFIGSLVFGAIMFGVGYIFNERRQFSSNK